MEAEEEASFHLMLDSQEIGESGWCTPLDTPPPSPTVASLVVFGGAGLPQDPPQGGSPGGASGSGDASGSNGVAEDPGGGASEDPADDDPEAPADDDPEAPDGDGPEAPEGDEELLESCDSDGEPC
jgi:hypothetical protein